MSDHLEGRSHHLENEHRVRHGLAHTLGLRVTVEGVETHEQLEFLVDKECDEVQGLIVSPPLAAKDFRKLLKETPQMALLAKT